MFEKNRKMFISNGIKDSYDYAYFTAYKEEKNGHDQSLPP